MIGWREYVWCLYWYRQRRWGAMNALDADAPLPAVLETGETEMACLADAVGGLRATGYAHHIERLMLFGNLVLLAGTDPAQALDWYHRAFIDGYDVGDGPQRARDGDLGRRRPDDDQALRRQRPLRQPDVGPTARVPLRPGRAHRRGRLPVHHPLLGLPLAQPSTLAANRRMGPVLGNLDRIDGERREIRARAPALRARFDA